MLVPFKSPYDYRIGMSLLTKPTALKSIKDLGTPDEVAELVRGSGGDLEEV